MRMLTAAAVLACGLATVACADPWKVGLHANVVLGGNVGNSAPAPGFGAQILYCPHYSYAVEMAISQYRVELESDGGDKAANMASVVVSGVIYPSMFTRPWNAFLGLGVGAYSFGPGTHDGEDVVRLNATVGMEYTRWRNVKPFVDCRYTFMSPLHQDDFDHGLLKAGLNYEF